MSRKESFTAIANSQKSLPFVAKLYVLDICGGLGYVPDRLSKIIFLIHRKLTLVNLTLTLQSKSMDWFLYDNGLRHERVKGQVDSRVKMIQFFAKLIVFRLKTEKKFTFLYHLSVLQFWINMFIVFLMISSKCAVQGYH